MKRASETSIGVHFMFRAQNLVFFTLCFGPGSFHDGNLKDLTNSFSNGNSLKVLMLRESYYR